MEAAKEKPPYVDFETRPVEDRAASIETGHYMTKDVVFALITPQGSKDKIEKVADIWIEDIATAAREGRFPAPWVEAYRGALAQFRAGEEIPLDGTPILGWQLASPSQQKNIVAANIRTVEDLANANEAALVAIGMGGRMLKERAASWLDSAENVGKVAASNEALRTENAQLQADLKTAREENKKLAAKLEKEDA